jgi:thiol-disulfide isomerase/thioredoxin
MNITSINIKNGNLSINYIQHTDKLTLLYSENCPYCRKFLPIWEQTNNVYNNKFYFEIIDCDKTPELSNKYQFRGLPTVFRQNADGEIDSTEGYQPFETFKSFITKYLNQSNYKLLLLYTDSCPYCKKFIPVMDEFETLYNIPVEKVSCSSNSEMYRKHNISGVPSIVIYNDDVIINTINGYMDLIKLISSIKKSIIDLQSYKKDVAKENKNTLTKKKEDVIVYINPSCPYCKKIEPVWKEAKEKYSNYFSFESINCSVNKSKCNGIQGVPTIKIVNDNIVGYTSFNDFKNKLEKYFNKYTLTIIINTYCDFSKKMTEVFKEFEQHYPDIFNYEIIDNTFDNNFKLDLFIDNYPATYLHDNSNIIKQNVGYYDYNEYKKWVLS